MSVGQNRKLLLLIMVYCLSGCIDSNLANQNPVNPSEPQLGESLQDPGIQLPVAYQMNRLDLADDLKPYTQLKTWESCTALSHSVINTALLDFYRYYKSNEPCQQTFVMMDTESSSSSSTATYTEQNSQVAGVLEADVVFANANQLFQLTSDEIRVYNTWPATDFEHVATLTFSHPNYELHFQKMLLTDNSLVVFARAYTDSSVTDEVLSNNNQSTHNFQNVGFMVLTYMLRDRVAPQLTSQKLYTHSTFVTARFADGLMHIFGTSDLTPDDQPSYYTSDFNFNSSTMCSADFELNQTGSRALNSYLEDLAQTLEGYDVTEKLPTIQTLNNAFNVIATQELDCQSVHATVLNDGLNLIWSDVVNTNAAADANDNEEQFDFAAQSAANQVYMNHDSLVLYGEVNLSRFDLNDNTGQSVDGSVLNLISIDAQSENPYTVESSGVIAGTIESPWQIDASENQVRVVVEVREKLAEQSWVWMNQAPNSVRFYDLEGIDNELRVVGEISNLVSDEEIYGVRYVGNQAYVVTMLTQYFWDPLFIIDTTHFTSPQVLGSLEMPGFSSYLELLDDDLLLGVGFNDGTLGWGEMYFDLKVSLYSVVDSTLPTEQSNYTIANSYSYAPMSHLQIHLDDSDGNRKLFVPYQIYDEVTGEDLQQLDVLAIATTGITQMQHYELSDYGVDSVVERTIRYHEGTEDVLYLVTADDVYPLSL